MIQKHQKIKHGDRTGCGPAKDGRNQIIIVARSAAALRKVRERETAVKKSGAFPAGRRPIVHAQTVALFQPLPDRLRLGLVAGFLQQGEHILLIGLDTRLIEGIHPQQVAADTARLLEEIEQCAQCVRRNLGNFDAEVGNAAVDMRQLHAHVTDPSIYGPASEGLKEVSHSSMFGGMMAILASAPFFLAGFETIPQGVEDAGGDITNVGKTVVMSVVLACIFYAILLICFGYAWPWKEFAHMENPSAATVFTFLYPGVAGEVLYWLITIGAIAGLFTTWNGFFMASASLLMGMGRGYLVPHIFAKQNKNGIPVPGLLVCLILSLIGPFLGAGLIGDITSFSAAAFVLSWTITSYSLIRLRKTEPDLPRPYKIPGGIAMGGFSAIVTTVVFILLFVPNNPVYMGKTASLMFVGWMVIGVILYLVSAVQRNKTTKEERRAAMFSHANANTEA